MAIGSAQYVGTWNLYIGKPPWAPVTAISGTALASGWSFNPDAVFPCPFRDNALPGYTGSGVGNTVDFAQFFVFDLTDGPTDLIIAGGSTDALGGFNFWNNQLLTVGGTDFNWFFANQIIQGAATAWHDPPACFLPRDNLSPNPVLYRASDGYIKYGLINGVTGVYALDLYDPVGQNIGHLGQHTMLDTSTSGGGNPPFFLSTTQHPTTFDWSPFSPDDFNTTFVTKNAFHDALLYFWVEDDTAAQELIFAPSIGDPNLDQYINGGVGGAGFYACPLGFIAVFPTNGSGPTGQRFEIAFIDRLWSEYVLVNLIPVDTESARQIVETTAPSVNMDLDGNLWFNSGSIAAAQYPLVMSFKDTWIANPIGGYLPIDLPCFDPCVTVP